MTRMRIWAVRTVQKVNLLERDDEGEGKRTRKRRKKIKKNQKRMSPDDAYCAGASRRVKNKCVIISN